MVLPQGERRSRSRRGGTSRRVAPWLVALLVTVLIAPPYARAQRAGTWTAAAPGPEWTDTTGSSIDGLWTSSPRRGRVGESAVTTSPGASQRPVLLLAGAGLLGGAAGMVGGAYLGSSAEGCGTPPCGAAGLTGAALGEVLGMSLGVHLANGRRGAWAADLMAALASGVAGGMVLARILPATGTANDLVLVSVPLIQIVATVITERRTADAER